jgi:hypothetical protein
VRAKAVPFFGENSQRPSSRRRSRDSATGPLAPYLHNRSRPCLSASSISDIVMPSRKIFSAWRRASSLSNSASDTSLSAFLRAIRARDHPPRARASPSHELVKSLRVSTPPSRKTSIRAFTPAVLMSGAASKPGKWAAKGRPRDGRRRGRCCTSLSTRLAGGGFVPAWVKREVQASSQRRAHQKVRS